MDIRRKDKPMQDTNYRRLYRSNKEIMIGGVAGGLAEYFKVDPLMVRLLIVLLALVTAAFPVMLAYFIMWVIIPRNPE